MSQQPGGQHPSQGGSYVKDTDGKLTRVAFTAPDPVPAPPAAPEPNQTTETAAPAKGRKVKE